ncbi:6-carboxytetrahydropterin synthase [Pseudovibrio sp. Ad26]|uniref:6-pyruvoyl trahydropterin synthase family protein n=1 Tax=Pseudovibrio sp. Ad26 TaxID=989410 RepID=UPI0007AE56E7|nr:6-carboxytetrahydropterin synthase [Pseudovibrio sp. Ad26]KZL16105.1 6-carboxy-5,6,7,8-tetrahydropterin synthase [Pseudovibrio sp. Ad26]
MYSVEISNHIMIAHSLKGEVFGPASQLHGLTAHVHVAIYAEELDENGIVIDIGNALDVLAEILHPFNYKNLDDLPQFRGRNTTVDFLCSYIYQRVCDAAYLHKLGREPGELSKVRVSISENPNARASYEAPLTASEAHE